MTAEITLHSSPIITKRQEIILASKHRFDIEKQEIEILLLTTMIQEQKFELDNIH
jgi:hypothetical protein